MNTRSLREAADAAETRQARQVKTPTRIEPLSETDLADVIEVDAVDEYVDVTGEYPMSGDIAEGDVTDETIIPEVIGADPTLGNMGADIDQMPGLPSDGRARGKAPRRTPR